MVIVQRGRTTRKPSGGRFKIARGKRKFETGSIPAFTKIGKQKIEASRTKNNNRKMKVFGAQYVNLFDPKTKKYTKTPIKIVVECQANRHFVRRNVIVKGTIITTDLGKAKVTSRPGQDGTVNAVLVS